MWFTLEYTMSTDVVNICPDFGEYRKYASMMIAAISKFDEKSASIVDTYDKLRHYLECDSDTFCENISEFVSIVRPFMMDHRAISSGKKAVNGSILSQLSGLAGQLIEKNYKKTSAEDEYLPFKYSIVRGWKNNNSWLNEKYISSDNRSNFPKSLLKIFAQIYNSSNGMFFKSDPAITAIKREIDDIINADKFWSKNKNKRDAINAKVSAITNNFSTYYFIRNESAIEKFSDKKITSAQFVEKLGGGVYLNLCQTSAITCANYDFYSLDFDRNILLKIIIEYMNTGFDPNIVAMSVQPAMILLTVSGVTRYEHGVTVRFYLANQIVLNTIGKNAKLEEAIKSASAEISNIIASFITHCGIDFDNDVVKRILRPAPEKIYLASGKIRDLS